MEIQPGTTVKVTVISEAKTPKVQKTLARLFLKDPVISKAHPDSPKPAPWKIRGGRRWYNRPKGSVARVPQTGDSASILATVDTIRDIHSVQKHVKVE